MNQDMPNQASRREFLKNTGRIAAASALAGVALPHVYAAENNTLQVALIGCGGRGTGAVADALSSKFGPLKLVAMADAFKDRLDSSYGNIKKQFGDKIDVPTDRQFVGLDAYKNAMDCLKPGDIAIFATPLAFRWVHFDDAVKKGLHVFMEKPLTTDGPTSRRMLKIAEDATAKNLKVGVGLMSRHSRALQELAKRIHDGDIGDIIMMRGYRMQDPIVGFNSVKPADMTEVEFQLRKFHSFIWASGGIFSDYLIHIIDHLCWMKNAWPTKAFALGGRQVRTTTEGKPCVDQNFDNYAVEYTFDDGSKFLMDCRSVLGCQESYASYLQGTKGIAIGSKSGDCGMPSSTYKGQLPKKANRIWQSKIATEEANPYLNEWNDLLDAIRNDKPYNEAKRGVEASVVTSMGRFSAHTGREVTFEQMLNSEPEYAPNLDKLTLDGPAPLMPDADGKYPIPQPGIVTKTEY
jgi:predicted dehydrogenase